MKNMKNRQLYIVLIQILLFFLCVMPAAAFQFTPISQEFASSGAGANRTFRIINDSTQQIAVQVDIMNRSMDITGEETRTDASNLFTIYPKQSAIPPNGYQTVYIRWNGPADINEEQTFRIIARQLPVDFSQQEDQFNIRVLLVYEGTLYVVPENIEYDIRIHSAEPVEKEDGAFIKLILENTGNAHALLNEPKLTLTSSSSTGASKVVLEGEAISMLAGRNIFGGNKRQFFIPWPEGLEQGELDAQLSSGLVR